MRFNGHPEAGKKHRPVLLSFCIWLLFAMNGHPQSGHPAIELSKASPNYENWLKRENPAVTTVDLYLMPIDSALKVLGRCDGLVLTGGEDVYPGWYGMESETHRCTEINRHRDSLDMALVSRVLALQMPLIAICRGYQVVNVYLKGTLVIDIPEDIGKMVIHQQEDYQHCFHKVTVPQGTLLASVSHCDTARVTSNHHQAIARLSPELKVCAWSDDKLPEAIEWREPESKSFLLGVQWHPERMEKSNPLSGLVAIEFLKQSARYAAANHQNNK